MRYARALVTLLTHTTDRLFHWPLQCPFFYSRCFRISSSSFIIHKNCTCLPRFISQPFCVHILNYTLQTCSRYSLIITRYQLSRIVVYLSFLRLELSTCWCFFVKFTVNCRLMLVFRLKSVIPATASSRATVAFCTRRIPSF